MSTTKLVYMCPICRNRVEYNISSVTMYTHENKLIDGALEEIEIEQPINTAAIVTTINPLKCAHLKNTDKSHSPYKMIAVPEWTPTLVDKIVKIFPDIYNISLPMFTVWGDDGKDSTCSLRLCFSTNDTISATRFIDIAKAILDKNINGYKSTAKIKIGHAIFPASNDKGDTIKKNVIMIFAPSIDFMKSNKGRALGFCNFIENIIYQFNNYDQITIGGV